MNPTTFTLDQQGAVLRLTFNNPPVNLISDKMVAELFQLAGGLQANTDIKVILIDSADKDFFIAHYDLNDLMGAAGDPARAGRSPKINGFQSLMMTWQMLPQVKIAKVDGICRGGGLEFILALDMRFASTGSRFCLPEASGGFVAGGGGATRTLMALGPARGLEFLLSSRDFSGEEAERYGLVNRALPAAELDAYVDALVAKIVLRSHAAISMNKQVMRATFAGAVEAIFAGLAAENDGLRIATAGTELAENVEKMIGMGQTREIELDLPGSIETHVLGVK